MARARDIENGLLREEWAYDADDPGRELFREYAGRWLDKKKATRKHATYLSYTANLNHHVLPAFGDIPLRNITRVVLGEAVEEETLSVKVSARPGKHLPKQRGEKPEVYGFDGRDAIEDVVRENDPDLLPAIMLGFRAGLRIGEVCSLTWDDVDFSKKKIMVRHTYSKRVINSPKGGRERMLPISDMPELETVLLAYRTKTAERNLKIGTRRVYLALSKVNAKLNLPVSDTWIQSRYKKYLGMAGFTPSGKFHITRHSFGSHRFAVGASSPDVRDLMGHLERMERHANARKQAEGQEGSTQ